MWFLRNPESIRQGSRLLQYIDKYTHTKHIYQLYIYRNGFIYYVICSVSHCLRLNIAEFQFQESDWVYTCIYISMLKLLKNYKDWENICRSIRKGKGVAVEQKHLELLWVNVDGLGMNWELMSVRAAHWVPSECLATLFEVQPWWSLTLIPWWRQLPICCYFKTNSVNIFGQGTIVSAR